MVEADPMPVIQTLSEGQRGIEDQKRKRVEKGGRQDACAPWRSYLSLEAPGSLR
jgi:hypothetical protein